jgi:hypothetical protein
MKNAKTYEKKIKKLLPSTKADKPPVDGLEDPLRVLVEASLEENTAGQRGRVAPAMAEIDRMFADLNDLRVAQAREVVECIGRDFPQARRKAQSIRQTLGAIYARRNALDASYMQEMTKRDLRRHLDELGLSPYVAASMMIRSMEGHGVPVDDDLRDCLELDEYIHPNSDIPDVQGFLERIVPSKIARSAHEELRRYLDKNATKLTKHRDALREHEEAQRRQAREEADAQARAEQKAQQDAAEAEESAKGKSGSSRKRASASAGKKASRRASAAARGKTSTSSKSSSSSKRSGSSSKSTKRSSGKGSGSRRKSTKKSSKKSS